MKTLAEQAREAMDIWAATTPEGAQFQKESIEQYYKDREWENRSFFEPNNTDEEAHVNYEGLLHRYHSMHTTNPEEKILEEEQFNAAWNRAVRMRRKLSKKHKKILKLHLFKGLTFKECGAELGVHRGRACAIYYQAVFRLRAMVWCLENKGYYTTMTDREISSIANRLYKEHRAATKAANAALYGEGYRKPYKLVGRTTEAQEMETLHISAEELASMQEILEEEE